MSSFPTRGGDNDRADIRTQKNKAAHALQHSVNFKGQSASLSAVAIPEQQELQSGSLWLLYDGTGAAGGDVLTAGSLERMRSIESRLMAPGVEPLEGREHWLTGQVEHVQYEQTFGGETRVRSYPDFCLLEKDACAACARQCRPPLSLQNVLYPTVGDVTLSRQAACPSSLAQNLTLFYALDTGCAAAYASCSGLVADKLKGCVLKDGRGSERVDDAQAAFKAEMFDTAGKLKNEYAFFFDKSFSASNLKSSATRSTLFYGRPIAGFSTTADEEACRDAQPKGKVGEVVVPGFERPSSITQRQVTEEYFGYVGPLLDREHEDATNKHFQFYYYCADLVSAHAALAFRFCGADTALTHCPTLPSASSPCRRLSGNPESGLAGRV
jgi:hypothetical protein